ncbi:MAG: folate-binding protein YgfZ [Pseudomonadales bacterium]|nr:folate-binding protein YgfZ [Pseudomonadales bacterium]
MSGHANEVTNLNCCFTVLDNEALLHLEGPDTLTFLQGQLTCDTRKLSSEQALPGLYCTPQGRVICDFLLLQLAPGHVALRLRSELRADSAATLAKYIVFSKSRLLADDDDWQLVGCWGPGAASALRGAFGEVPGGQYQISQGEGRVLVQTDAGGEMFECLLRGAQAGTLLDRLQQDASPAARTAWEASLIRAGVPRIAAATSGEFIPQMLNYDLTGQVSFSKGCYTGQEVIARMHYRGKPKRRLYLASLTQGELAGGDPPAPGLALYSAGEQSVGTVVNAAQGEGGQWQLLVTATREGATGGLHLASPAGPRLALGELPYPVPQ